MLSREKRMGKKVKHRFDDAGNVSTEVEGCCAIEYFLLTLLSIKLGNLTDDLKQPSLELDD